MRKFLSSPVSFFGIVLPVPVVCAVLRFMACDDVAQMIGWVIPLIALVVTVLAGSAWWVARRKKAETMVPSAVLWKLFGLSFLFCALADYHLYKAIYFGSVPESVAVWASSLLLVMGSACLFWAALRRWSLVLWVPFLLLGPLQAIGFVEYGCVLNSLVLAETLEANAEEAAAYLTPVNIALIILCVGLVVFLSVALCRIMRKAAGRLTLASSGMVLCAAAMWLGVPVPWQEEDTDLYWPYTEAYRVFDTVDEALHANVATIDCVQDLPSAAQEPSSLPTLHGDEGVVLVVHIGESVRADRMGINGYERDTTPWLSSQAGKGLINFTDCISSACDTCQAQITILTDGRRNLYEKDPAMAPTVGSVFELFSANGFELMTFSGLRAEEKLKYDRVGYMLTRSAAKRFYAPGSPWTAIPLAAEALQGSAEGRNLLFFINNRGSHTPFNYYDHDNPPFTPCIDNFEIPSQHAEEVNNAYDNTIHYTDVFFRRMAEQLKGRPFVYVYVSDHGEYLGHDGIWGRGGLGSANISYHDTTGCRVGMFVLYSPEFEKLHPHFAEALQQLASHADMTVGHEHIFHTLLGLFGLQTPHYRPELDLCSPSAQPYSGPQPKLAPQAENACSGRP